MIISVASTMVLSRLLIDGGQLQATHGKVMIGITLVEDLVVVVLTILMPVLVSLYARTTCSAVAHGRSQKRS